MSGKQQRSTAMPDYKLLAGKVSRRSSDSSARHAAHAPAADAGEDAAFGDASNTSAGGIFKGAAVQILQSERRLMSTGEITKLALERKLVKATGKTPENTMASALYTDVRKRGSNSPFFKPKEGLFGLKTWLAEVWLQEWLAKEGIAIEEFAPELADCPPAKKQRYARQQHKGENDHHRAAHFSARGPAASHAYHEVDTDSDEKTSNLNLLLEAADEIEREDDRLEANPAHKRASPSPSPRPAAALKPPRGKKAPLRHLQVASDPGAHPGMLPLVQLPNHPYPFMIKGIGPPIALGPNHSLPPFMNYSFLSPAMAQQLLTGTSPALASSAPHALGMLPMAIPFPHPSARDPLAPIPPITPSISPTATPLAATSPSATAPASTTAPAPSLELTGRSIASILQDSKAAKADSGPDKENPNAAPAKAPVNILNLPLPTFDVEDTTPAPDSAPLDPLDPLLKPPSGPIGSPSPPTSLGDKPPLSPATDPIASPAGEDTSATTSVQVDDLHAQDSTAATATQPQLPLPLLRAIPSVDVLMASASEARGLEPAGAEGGDVDRATVSGRLSMDAAAAQLGVKDLKQVTEQTPGTASQMHDKINTYRQHIQLLERSLGNMHPQVGKAYVFLGRALQHEGSRWSLVMAQRALLRAWQILASVKTRVDQEQPVSLNDFSYLMGHLQDSQTHQALHLQQLQLAGAQAAAAVAPLQHQLQQQQQQQSQQSQQQQSQQQQQQQQAVMAKLPPAMALFPPSVLGMHAQQVGGPSRA